MRRRLIRILVALAILCGLYPVCFHGKRYASCLQGGGKAEIHCTDRQYFLGILLWESHSIVRKGRNREPLRQDEIEALGAGANAWRGFGILGLGWFRKSECLAFH